MSTDVRGGVLSVYSSSALTGPQAATSEQIVTGEKLALGLHHGAVGDLLVKFVSMDSSRGADSGFDRTVLTNNAQSVVGDSSAIAYLGDTVPGATRVVLPILSAAAISVLSPSDPDPQLTPSPGAAPDGAYLRGVQTGHSLASLSDAQIAKLAGPGFPAAFRRAFGGEPTAANARGYVTMTVLLEAIKAAGVNGGDRAGVARALGPVVQRALGSAH